MREIQTGSPAKLKLATWFFFRSVTRATCVPPVDGPGKKAVDEFHHARALHRHRARRVRSILELHFAAPGKAASCFSSHATSASMREALMMSRYSWAASR